MNILLVSQCSQRALPETRRILDQFAERRGDRTWQTAITEVGLNTLRKRLRKTARRNTAVACHWIKGANQTELVWIVGNQRQFNAQGAVPTNRSQRDILQRYRENLWPSTESISLVAAIAGLFHDFGKANDLFQRGLRGKDKSWQPYRHEWVSLRLFLAWIGQPDDDREWLLALSHISAADEAAMLDNLVKDQLTEMVLPFTGLPPVARLVAWLILSHHRLPSWQGADRDEPDLQYIENWFDTQLNADWNATNHHSAENRAEDFQAVWRFTEGTPLRSELWCRKARKLAQRARQAPSFFEHATLEQRFPLHLARLVLMLADRHYSSLPATPRWQAKNFLLYANSDKSSRALKQQLDEHTIGVAQNALLLGRSLPLLKQALPAIGRHKKFQQRSQSKHFRWQDRAYDLACSVKQRSLRQGFFGVNMASTGRGKTLGNGRIMYGLADPQQGCRFSVALGLRTLTLQTGDALRQRLYLDEDDLAVLIGSQAAVELHEGVKRAEASPEATSGSESSERLFAEHHYVSYQGTLSDGRLSQWLKSSPTMNALLNAPILVTTIDQLIGATEGIRGGKQIVPMLRLLTADLVLDEPDEFDIKDLPALCRLVNWAGMLGSRVLLSSATLPPSLVSALFSAYRNGRAAYEQACGEPGRPINICCAWFDEFAVQQQDIGDVADFKLKHQEFVEKRGAQLVKQPILHRGELLTVPENGKDPSQVVINIAGTVLSAIQALHATHRQTNAQGQTLSVGLVRIANINPLVALAQQLLHATPQADTRIHYTVYHSQHPLAVRSDIEQCLDRLLTRHDPQRIWQIPEVSQALSRYPESNHIFVVLATSVAEVGRDHDYDWAIAEPSSMRSLVLEVTDNLFIIWRNVYCRTGSLEDY